MPDETRHESEDLQDFQVEDSTDTLSGAPGDDPLDRGVVPPERWSAGVRFGDTAAEQSEGESLDQLLAEEEPDPALAFEDDEDDEDEDEEDKEDEKRRQAVVLMSMGEELARFPSTICWVHQGETKQLCGKSPK